MSAGGRNRRWRLARVLGCTGLLLGATPMAASGDPERKLFVNVPAEGAFVGAKFVVKGTLLGAPRGAVVNLGELVATVADDGAYQFALTADRDGVRKLRIVYSAVGVPELVGLRNVTVDTTPPTIEDVRPEAESTVFVGDHATVAGRIVDAAPVEVRINGRETTVSAEGKFAIEVELPTEGSISVTIAARDLVGNSATPVVRRLTRWVDPGPPRLNFEPVRSKDTRVVWIARDFGRITLDEDLVGDARRIKEHDGKAASFGTSAHPLVVLVRAADPIPSARFELGMGVVRSLNGAILVTAPPHDAATSGVSADAIDLLPDASKDGSWHVRLDSKDWVISARDVKLLTSPGSGALPPPAKRSLEELGLQLKSARLWSVVRFRLTEPVPVRLLEEIRLNGCVGASVIVECADSATGIPSAGVGKPNRPPERGVAFKSRADARDSGKNAARRPAEMAVSDALAWLAAHQSPNGRWECADWRNWCDHKASSAGDVLEGAGDARFDVGVTGLALLAFLGAGHTDRSDGPFAKVVRDGLAYLKSVQDREGCFGRHSTDHYIYGHAIAASVMIEAFGMTRDENYKAPAQLALDFIAVCRNPYFAWRYGVKPGDNDTSVTAWMMLALHSAKVSNIVDERVGDPPSLECDLEAFEGIKAWIDKMTDPDTGRVGYQQRGKGPVRLEELVDRFPADKSESMTAVGVLARILLGENPRTSKVIQLGADVCARLAPTWNTQDGSIDMYYWYFGSLAMFQVGGEPWKKWEAAMKTGIIDQQHKDTDFCGYKGSWDPIDAWGSVGGRVYSTALMALACETWYRYEVFAATEKRR